ncbi:MAG: hypothetical protein CMN76_06170 [Spirochaetaceae bacterium]|nr:hypothetical protein [Spirochaetaceae bacterium]
MGIFGTVFWVLVIGLMSITILMPAEKDRGLQYYFPVVLRSAEGIRIGSRVQVLGVDQGYVNYLRYTPLDAKGRIILDDDPAAARPSESQVVIAVLNMRTQPVLFPDHRIYTRYPAVISDKIIDIRPGSKEAGEAQNPIIWNSQEMLFFRKTGSLPGGNGPIGRLVQASNYDDPLTIVADVVNENRGDIRRIVRNIAQTTDTMNTPGTGTVSLLLHDPELLDRTNASMRDLLVVLREGRLLAEDLRESQAPVSFLEAYLITMLRLAAGAPL